jgi:hypothetical protein
MRLTNRTTLSSERLQALFEQQIDGWPHRSLDVFIRYTRSRPVSGLCDYRRKRIHVNISRNLCFPYDIATHLARSQSNARYWWKEIYRLRVADEYQVALFVFLHELFHWLVRQAGRNTRRKEAMCDRFAARVLVDQYGASVLKRNGQPVERADWDFQDLNRFVSRARRLTRAELAARSAARVPVVTPKAPVSADGQWLLFPVES